MAADNSYPISTQVLRELRRQHIGELSDQQWDIINVMLREAEMKTLISKDPIDYADWFEAL